MREIFSGFTEVTHTHTRAQLTLSDEEFLYLESLLWGKTDLYFQIPNLSQLLLQLPHLPHLTLGAATCTLNCAADSQVAESVKDATLAMNEKSGSVEVNQDVSDGSAVCLGDVSPDVDGTVGVFHCLYSDTMRTDGMLH